MDINKLELAPFNIFDRKWALLTAGKKDDFNMMTISWGGMGTLWSKPVVTVYVKPIRYTYSFMEKSDYFTVSFYSDDYRKVLGVLGSKSGREIDKMNSSSLHPDYLEHGITFKEAQITIVLKKIYYQDIDQSKCPKDAIERYYKNETPHRMYIGEVVDIIVK